MASTEKQCEYIKCDIKFYGTKRAMYCCDKHGQYQRRLDSKADKSDHAIQEYADLFCDGNFSVAFRQLAQKGLNNEH